MATMSMWVNLLMLLLLLMLVKSTMEASDYVFEKGELVTTMKKVEESHPSDPPSSLLIVSPIRKGRYPVLFFVHGTSLLNSMYSDVFQHVASHGFIVVAPQLYFIPIPSQTEEIEKAALVANWLPQNLDTVLPQGVEGDLSKLTVSGHSRGGKTAFALALNIQETQLKLKISALIGVDPVAGTSKTSRTKPYILTYVPNSLDLSIPVSVIGSGLGNQSIIPLIGPSCAPNGVNHDEFFNECKGECSHFVVKEYGHMDMLNEGAVLPRLLCVNGKGSRDPMRKTLGGLIVAFLNAYLKDEVNDFDNILNGLSVAPAKLYPVEIKVKKQALNYAQL